MKYIYYIYFLHSFISKKVDRNLFSFCQTITEIILITGNQQINMSGNPNVSYVVADNGSTYPVYSYVPGNFGEQNQMDRMYYITKGKCSSDHINLHTRV